MTDAKYNSDYPRETPPEAKLPETGDSGTAGVRTPEEWAAATIEELETTTSPAALEARRRAAAEANAGSTIDKPPVPNAAVELLGNVRQFVQGHPMTSLAVGVLAGMICGRQLGGLSRN